MLEKNTSFKFHMSSIVGWLVNSTSVQLGKKKLKFIIITFFACGRQKKFSCS